MEAFGTITFLVHLALVAGSVIWAHIKEDDTIIIRFDSNVADKNARLVCRFRPDGLIGYTAMDWTKPNQYFPMLNRGDYPHELVLGYWTNKMVGWVRCKIYDRGVLASSKTVWLDRTRLSKWSYKPLWAESRNPNKKHLWRNEKVEF